MRKLKVYGETMKHLIQKMPEVFNEIPQYFESVEKVFESCEIPEEYQVRLLYPFFSQKAILVSRR